MLVYCFECFGDGFVVDVVDVIYEEQIGVKFGMGGLGFNLSEIDVVDVEFGQCSYQCIGLVVDVQYCRCVIGFGVCWRWFGLINQDEVGVGIGFVNDIVGQGC